MDLARYSVRPPPPYDVTSYFLMVTDDQDKYYGSVIMFTRSGYPHVGMYGIKRSILDIVTKSKLPQFKGISKLLISTIEDFARNNNLEKIIVVNPLETMVPILKYYSFTERDMSMETFEDTPERQFMKPISSSSYYFTRDVSPN